MANRFFSPTARGSDPLLGLYRDMNRLFDEVFAGWSPSTAMRSFGGTPSVDMHEEGDGLCVAAELPGVKRSDLDVRLDGDMLTISGEKRASSDPQQNPYHVMERSYGRFTRTVQLPFRPDPQAVSAEFEDGVLVVHLKRNAQQDSGRRIEVRGRDGPESSARQMGAGSGNESSMQAGAASASQRGAPSQMQGTGGASQMQGTSGQMQGTSGAGAPQPGATPGTGQQMGSAAGSQTGSGTQDPGTPGRSRT